MLNLVLIKIPSIRLILVETMLFLPQVNTYHLKKRKELSLFNIISKRNWIIQWTTDDNHFRWIFYNDPQLISKSTRKLKETRFLLYIYIEKKINYSLFHLLLFIQNKNKPGNIFFSIQFSSFYSQSNCCPQLCELLDLIFGKYAHKQLDGHSFWKRIT